jgi:hypothetical protein
VQKPWIASIPGTTKLSRLRENIGAAEVELSGADLRRLEEVLTAIEIQGTRRTVKSAFGCSSAVMAATASLVGKTQEDVANALNIKQPSVSKIEKQTDLYLSTLRSHIEAVGGKLELTMTLPV